MKKIFTYLNFPLGLTCLLMSGGCDADVAPDGDDPTATSPVGVSVTLSAREGFRCGTRADGTPADPELPNEKIKDWFVVFIDNAGKVAKVIQRSDAETGINLTANPAVEQETFKCILPTGTGYTVYAFANMEMPEVQTAIGIEFDEGKALASGWKAKIESAKWTSELNNWNIETGAIPMTGHKENVSIKNTIEETLSIEVVRMTAKVQFLFTNPTGMDITVESVSFDPVTMTPVSLFPKGPSGIDYSYLGDHAFTPLADAAYAPLSVTLNHKVESGKSDAPAAFYMKETLSNREKEQAFTVGLKFSHSNGVQYNMTKNILEYINRNDWIEIPIILSQYDIFLEAIFYPPIGGYPALLSTMDPDGTQVFTFGTEGDFAIVPKVFDKIAGTHLTPTDYEISLGTIPENDIYTKSIFEKLPVVTETSSSLPDEITGTLSSATGKALVPISVKIGNDTYTRSIYIIRS